MLLHNLPFHPKLHFHKAKPKPKQVGWKRAKQSTNNFEKLFQLVIKQILNNNFWHQINQSGSPAAIDKRVKGGENGRK